MKKQAFNPYLPSWEYIPDGEPYVFGDRVYVYGSHDRFGGYAYCQNDYVCWSAPVDDLGNWRYEGVIYPRNEDPQNKDGQMLLFAPDVTVGPDGRYYLYYVLDGLNVVSVAVCDEPAGRYQFCGYVHYEDGTRLGEAETDEPQFDPGVLTEGDRTYLYTGFCMPGDESRHGSMVTVLGPDMLTVVRKPEFVAPSRSYEAGTGFEGHAFFEASSIRKAGGRYYFIYSSVLSHELCYAVSQSPLGPFRYMGTIVSNCDLFIDSYKPGDRPMYYGGNNHGSIVEIAGEWYIFYHRHTNGTNYSRQGCMEKIRILEDGTIPQVEMTSCGGNGGPLKGEGEYPAYIACSLYCRDYALTVGAPGEWMDCRFPKITQDQPDGAEGEAYIANMCPGAVAGFKYFECRGVKRIAVRTRGGARGRFLVRTAWDGEVIGSIELGWNNEWKIYSAEVAVPDGVHALYFEFEGYGRLSFAGFELMTA
ncbi:MAG TPA: alpha-N-arabinofuranosidase [Lachnospiraceae bacterium]|nr:alpha-N-arabinofuranosidase [Lachnospiraceae bacterium]